MIRRSRILITLFVCAISLALVIEPGQAQGLHPLPPLPNQSVINAVINNSQGPTFTPLGVPGAIINSFGAFHGSFAGIGAQIDTQQAISYIDSGANVLQIVMPLLGSAGMMLQPTITTPDDGTAAQIIGGLYQWSTGTTLVVVTFNGGGKAKRLRFYYNQNGQLTYNEINLKKNNFHGLNGQPSTLDTGAIVAASELCYTIGLTQVCFPPDRGTRDYTIMNTIQNTYNTLAGVYSFSATFDIGNPVPDLVGHNYRLTCANSYAQGSSSFLANNVPGCTPNIIYTSAMQLTTGQPIAIFHVMAANDLKTYDMSGNPVSGGVPVGDYLVLNATPNINMGDLGVLLLASADAQHDYLIPSKGLEGFGSGDGSSGQAAIKDGSSWGSGW